MITGFLNMMLGFSLLMVIIMAMLIFPIFSLWVLLVPCRDMINEIKMIFIKRNRTAK